MDSVVCAAIGSAHWEGVLKGLIEEHGRRTGSGRAAHMLAHWAETRQRFRQICPKEMLGRLPHALADEKTSFVAAE
jgi:glutamate synthase (NADPH/NADH) large chain